MELTTEQITILNTNENIKINAVAGSGKTTTIIEYAKSRPSNARILYLAFNKTVKLEAAKKFSEKGLRNVRVETAHSLAYRYIVQNKNFTVKPHAYTTSQIAELLQLSGEGERHAEYIVANHINKFIAYFCNSDKAKVQDINYLDVVFEKKAIAFVKKFYNYIESKTRLLLGKMDKGEIDIIHDFYLKKFQLSNPVLPYDYILFDEGQDASPAMLDVFFKQKAIKLIVGDSHQQIYGWRFAINSLEKADYKNFYLSSSFRFAQHIADLAMETLQMKKLLSEYDPIEITGKGKPIELQSKAILARTNLGLLLRAIKHVTDNDPITPIYFEGNINSYTYADDGASLYDVLNLYNGKRHLIRDKLIKSMKDLADLEDYIKKTEDVQLGMMLEIVNEYGNDIPDLIKTLKENHVDNDDKEKADVIFSTVHRCKGMEYDVVELVEDFISEEKILKILDDNPKKEDINFSKINEEINLLYVAITRTKNILKIPKNLIPIDFEISPKIQIVAEIKEEEKPNKNNQHSKWKKEKDIFDKGWNSPFFETEKEIKKPRQQLPKEAYSPWSQALDDELIKRYCNGESVRNMAIYFGRTQGAINARIKKLELEDLYG